LFCFFQVFSRFFPDRNMSKTKSGYVFPFALRKRKKKREIEDVTFTITPTAALLEIPSSHSSVYQFFCNLMQR